MNRILIIFALVLAILIFVYYRLSIEQRFNLVYHLNLWGNKESRSGPGSTLESTKCIRQVLSQIFKEFKIKTLLDSPCGDFNWMPQVLKENQNIIYCGTDVVKPMIAQHQKNFPHLKFYHSDLTKHIPSKYDLILCRDLLNHLSNKNVVNVLKNLKNSKSTYLLLNNKKLNKNKDKMTTDDATWRDINFTIAPYNLTPLKVYNCPSGDSFILLKIN